MAGELNAGAVFQPLPAQSATVLETVRYDVITGLVPVVVQDIATGHVLMMAYANREALKRTFGTGHAWFWSRSRRDFWRKGATSGNVLHVVEVRVDCDGDTVLYLVNPVGPACHTGETSCFYRTVERDGGAVGAAVAHDGAALCAAEPSGPVVTENGGVAGGATGTGHGDATSDGTVTPSGAGHSAGAGAPNGIDPAALCTPAVLERLWQVVEGRYAERPRGSYTTYLFEQGVDKSAKKVGEEAVEIVIAAKNAAARTEAGRAELATESADLLYHLMVVWKSCGVTPADVWRVLADRAT